MCNGTMHRIFASGFANGVLSPHPVGQKESNNFGLYDMLGNVWEFCEDYFGDYTNAPIHDPSGPSQGTVHIIRGGSRGLWPKDCRNAGRAGYPNIGDFGFRVVVNEPAAL